VSVEAITWAIDREGLPSGAKLLLLVIANSADHAGVAWTGRDLLAKRCCCSRRTVSSQLRRLEDERRIARFERRRNGWRTSDWIILAPGADRRPMLDADDGDYRDVVDVIIAATSSHADSSLEDHGRAQVQPEQTQVKSEVESGEASRKTLSTGSVRDPSVDPSVDPCRRLGIDDAVRTNQIGVM
jgi:hypothetical protein